MISLFKLAWNHPITQLLVGIAANQVRLFKGAGLDDPCQLVFPLILVRVRRVPAIVCVEALIKNLPRADISVSVLLRSHHVMNHREACPANEFDPRRPKASRGEERLLRWWWWPTQSWTIPDHRQRCRGIANDTSIHRTALSFSCLLICTSLSSCFYTLALLRFRYYPSKTVFRHFRFLPQLF